MSRAEGLQESDRQSPTYPWYYHDVPGWIIAAILSVVVFAILAVGFRPVRIVPPVTVVAPGDQAPAWKAPIPQQLPMPSVPAIPPPVIPRPAAPDRSAIDTILPKVVSPPQLPEKSPKRS
jgi:hypothetical protein